MTGKHGVLQSMGSQRAPDTTEQQLFSHGAQVRVQQATKVETEKQVYFLEF